MSPPKSVSNIWKAARSTNSPVRVMVVDDSLTVRTVFKRMIEGDRRLVVVADASSAERALTQLENTPVDVILLDLEMPGIGGLTALPDLIKASNGAQVLVVSSLTQDGAEHSLAALSMGAADTMPKPQAGGFDETYRKALLDKISALGGVEEREPSTRAMTKGAAAPPVRNRFSAKPAKIVGIGASTGGIHALNIVLRSLPQKFDLPILITQHLPASFVPVFARMVEEASGRKTKIAGNGTEIESGDIILASGKGHLEVIESAGRIVTHISKAPAKSGCLPSVDPMLESLAKTFDGHALAVILSGMGRDGADGAKTLVDAGGSVIAQDADSSAVWGMPGAVAKAGLTSDLLPPENMAAAIVKRAGALTWS